MEDEAGVVRPTLAERQEAGEAARARTDPGAHEEWHPAADRPDPVALLEAQNSTRDRDLVPVRHGRMMASPFTFFRGTATVMAADLATTPTAGLDVQLCGDAHLSNFGVYASPGRKLVFDLNDFDETLPGPFEYDVKRLAASFAVAARNNGFDTGGARDVALVATRAYRRAMADFAGMSTMDVWYARISGRDLQQELEKVRKHRLAAVAKDKKRRRVAAAKEMAEVVDRTDAAMKKARGRTSLQALSKLAEVVDGRHRIVSAPPTLIPLRDVDSLYGLGPAQLHAAIHDEFREYRASLPATCRRLLERFEVVDTARKVVGVGSVGTRDFVVLLRGRDEQDPLFLQVKEATRSVLEAHLPPTEFATPGERVVVGQQMMQATSDIFLGWSEGVQDDRHYYWRQLRDMKGSADVEGMVPLAMNVYAKICGWALARSHARTGDAIAIATYLGEDKGFERAIADFATSYADQNDLDYQAFRDAISSGRIEATPGI